jgi:F0F1-type ATP synthase delta subunit
MSGRIVAERYAQGLSKAIEDENILVSVLDSLTDLSELFEDHSDLYHVMANPVVSAEKRGP